MSPDEQAMVATLTGVSITAFMTNVHLMRVMATNGLISPADVDLIYSSMLASLEGLAPLQQVADLTAQLDRAMPALRAIAEQAWRA